MQRSKDIDTIECNRLAWNQAAPYHEAAEWETLLLKFSDPAYLSFPEWHKEILESLDVKGKNIAHPCCNNGRELISLQRMGAKHCLGIDFSEGFITMGRDLANHAKSNIEFAQCSALAIPDLYNHSFDTVYISVGTLGWFQDLNAFFESCGRLLNATGEFWILEMHPILDMYEPKGSPTVTVSSYFRAEPFVETDGLDYVGGKTYESSPTFWFPHRMSEIFKALLRQGFSIKQFDELDKEISGSFVQFKNFDGPKPPLSYFLRAVR